MRGFGSGRNKAAVVSAVYLVLMTVACLIGPALTGHEFTTIYADYVRVPPSLQPYPHGGQIETALKDALSRAHVDLVSWEREGDDIVVRVASTPADRRARHALPRPLQHVRQMRQSRTGRSDGLVDDDVGAASSGSISSSAPTITAAIS